MLSPFSCPALLHSHTSWPCAKGLRDQASGSAFHALSLLRRGAGRADGSPNSHRSKERRSWTASAQVGRVRLISRGSFGCTGPPSAAWLPRREALRARLNASAVRPAPIHVRVLFSPAVVGRQRSGRGPREADRGRPYGCLLSKPASMTDDTAYLHSRPLKERALGEHRYEVTDPVVSGEASEQGDANVHHPLGL